jgi:hypothetical protein
LGTQAIGMTGTIVAGPTLANGITWWQINYDSGVDGWSGADNFYAGEELTLGSSTDFVIQTIPAAKDFPLDNTYLPSSPTELRLISE